MNTITETVKSATHGLLQVSPEALRDHNDRVRAIKESRVAAAKAALRAKWNAPVRQVNTTARKTGEWYQKLLSLQSKLEQGNGGMFALVGGRGNGKTQMAVELMRATVERLKPARFITAIGFFMEVKATYRKDATKSEKDVLDEFCAPQLLVLDEISKRSDSNWENDLLFELLNRRYNECKDTILISNQPKPELDKFLGASIVSRMNESGGFVLCDWPTFRT